jgi:hypothetical protein
MGVPIIIPIPGISGAAAAVLTVLGILGTQGGKFGLPDLTKIGQPSGGGASGGGAGSGAGGGGGAGTGGSVTTGTTGVSTETAVTETNTVIFVPPPGGGGGTQPPSNTGLNQNTASTNTVIFTATGTTNPQGTTNPENNPTNPNNGTIILTPPTETNPPTETAPTETQRQDNTATTTIIVTCPTPDMGILLMDGEFVNAGDLRPGMWVYTAHEHTGNWGNYPVTRVSREKADRVKITTNSGSISCSLNHKFKIDGGWVEAKDVVVGQKLSGQQVVKIDPLGVGDVMSITVDDAHTYVCEGFLSHNKTPPTETQTQTTTGPIVVITTPTTETSTVTTPVTPIFTPVPTATTADGSTTINLNIPTQATPTYNLPTTEPYKYRDFLREGTTSTSDLAKMQTGITDVYGTAAQGYSAADLSRLQNIFGGFGQVPGLQSMQTGFTQAATTQTIDSNRALRQANLADITGMAPQLYTAEALRRGLNPEMYASMQMAERAISPQLAADTEALQRAQSGQLSQQDLRAAQQSAREAYGARGMLMGQGAINAEIMNADQVRRQREQEARANVQQSLGNLYQSVGARQANVFDPFAATLGQQYGMQTQNVGLSSQMFNQAQQMAGGGGGYGYAQQTFNPFQPYAQDVYQTNVNAYNAAQIAAANRQAALEAAKMGRTGDYAQVFGGLLGSLAGSGGFGSVFKPTPTTGTPTIT